MARFFDHYSRVARLYPALLALTPVICTVVLLFPNLVEDLKKGAVSLLALGCMFYLLSSMARSFGKKTEGRLLKKWGGWPTTLLLRHRDEVIDSRTKTRYHAKLATLCPDLAMPGRAEELAQPLDADAIYRSATKRLAEARRGPVYQMIEDENASYGFRRNMLGLKPAALVIAVLAAIGTGVAWWLLANPSLTAAGLLAAIQKYPHLFILLVIDLGSLALWATLINPAFVRQAADEYAIALFRSLDAV